MKLDIISNPYALMHLCTYEKSQISENEKFNNIFLVNSFKA